ncbi:MAG: hypothetical protein ACP5HM_05260 [Anaerolineae bacterium]
MSAFLLVIRIVAGVLYVLWVISRVQRRCEAPPSPDGSFVRQENRFFNLVFQLQIPLLSLGGIIAVWGGGLLELGAWGLIWLLFTPVGFWLLLQWMSTRKVPLKPSLQGSLILPLSFLILLTASAAMLVAVQIFPPGKFGGDLRHLSWFLPRLVAVLGPPLFLIYIIRHWTADLLPLRPGPNEEEDGKGSYRWSKETQWLAAQYLLGFFSGLPKPTHVVEDGELKERIKGNPFLGTGPGLVITEPENVVAVRESSKFKRFVGPGGEFTGVTGPDIAYAVLDLQTQFRVTRIDAMTRDGITLSVPCSSIFKIDAGGQQVELGKPWPYRERAAYLALHTAQEVNPAAKSLLEEHEAVSWKELPLNTAKPKLEQLIAGYTLDELYATKRRPPIAQLPRKEITQTLRAYVRQQMEKVGIAVRGGGVGAALIPHDEEITRQRVDTWKASWAEKLEMQEGKAAAVYLEEAERVRVSILNELIELARELNETGAANKQVLLSARLLEMLENIARNPEIERLKPEQRVESKKDEEEVLRRRQESEEQGAS